MSEESYDSHLGTGRFFTAKNLAGDLISLRENPSIYDIKRVKESFESWGSEVIEMGIRFYRSGI